MQTREDAILQAKHIANATDSPMVVYRLECNNRTVAYGWTFVTDASSSFFGTSNSHSRHPVTFVHPDGNTWDIA